MLNLTKQNGIFVHKPFPHGLLLKVMNDKFYKSLVDNFPDTTYFSKMNAENYNKFALSERCNPEDYYRFVKENSYWNSFYSYIKSYKFKHTVFEYLLEYGIGHEYVDLDKLSARFEFSSIPAYSGFIKPHTDIKSKLLTIVIPMVTFWNQEWGHGGTDILEPKDKSKILKDYQADLSEFNIVDEMGFTPNSATIFVKTNNSWHSVGPFNGPAGVRRNSLTINIENGK